MRARLVALGLTLALAAGGAGWAAAAHDGRSAAASAFSPAPATTPALVVAAGTVAPTAAGVEGALGPALTDPYLGPDVAGSVVDVASGDVLFDRDASASVPPASTAKLLTAAAALSVLGGQARLTTRVVLAGADTVVLVGGGDPTLAGPRAKTGYPDFARLDALADATASALRARRITTARVAVDTSADAGPATAPGWRPGYVGEGDVAPVTALEVDEGRVDPQQDDRFADPALAAGRGLATLLAARGVRVAPSVTNAAAPAGAAVLATVSSPPVAVLVERTLTDSDNDLAEALARAVARREARPATFAAAAATVVAAVHALGVDTTGVRLVDGSGLSHDDRVTPAVLSSLVRLACARDRPALRPIVTGLPVAGFTGTLGDRYRSGPVHVAAGQVRAKTGTLDGVSSLAGVVTDRDGRLLSFAFVAARAPYYVTAQPALDRLAARLAGCGCR